jgi:nitroimidazol reductase NimA-like FMN-containing flavoprotein (pyridoxamine 5'-phosphate oxidase superfamily)
MAICKYHFSDYASAMPQTYSVTSRTALRRLPKRGTYDRDTVHRILDEGFVCHLAFVADGQPYALPTGYGRDGDRVYVHGSAASRMTRALADGIDVCLTVTLIDGLVLARSAFHHSMNYRSVVVLGRARPVTAADEKRNALRCITNHIVPGRWEDVRPPTEQEMKGTSVLALDLEEVSAKIRTGPPVDDEEDYALPIWAGVVPVTRGYGAPLPDDRVRPDAAPVDLEKLKR